MMNKHEIKTIESKEELKYLYDNWAMTWEGLIEEGFELACQECGTPETVGYIIKGKTMNKICHLSGDNSYPDDLNIFAIYPFHGLAIQYGARWMTDIIDNNSYREGFKPFK